MNPGKTSPKTTLGMALATCLLVPIFTNARAENSAATIDEMAVYLEFSEHGGNVMFAEQIPREDGKRFVVIDTRDAAQYAKEHLPGAIPIDWRQVLAQRPTIPRDKPMLVYCNSGSLSAQASFDEWQAKGGFDASSRATAPVKH